MAIYGISGDFLARIVLASAVFAALLLAILHLRFTLNRKAESALRMRERRVELALNGSNDGLWHWDLLTDSTHISARVHELLNYGPNEIESHIGAFLNLVHPDDRQAAHQSFAAHLKEHTPYDTEFRLRLKSGEYRWFRVRGNTQRDGTDRPTGIAGSITDITDRKLAEAAIGRHAMQQGLIAEFGQMALKNPSIDELMAQAMTVAARGMPAEFCRLLAADADDHTLKLVGAWGWDAEWLERRTYDAMEETQDRFIIGVREAVIIEDFTTETRFEPSAVLRAHGVRGGVEMLICGAQHAHGVLGIYSREPRRFTREDVNFLRGITNILASSLDRKVADERLTYLAQFDALTGLPNRSMFLDRLWQTLSDAERGALGVGVLFVDLDRFKLVNDTLGHSAGDELLLMVAQRLLGSVRSTDLVGRLGGDEFAIALGNLPDGAVAGSVSQEVLTALAKPFELAGKEIYISASLGIGIYPADGKEPDTLLKNADTAMYRAKESGRNTFQYYIPAMNERAVQRLKAETELRGALERGEFLIHYQPKARISSGEISGFEALLRWNHPDGNLVLPGDFITILEETGQIIPVGEWVVKTVCRQLREWQIAGLPLHPIAVNLSPRQFAHTNLDAVVGEILRSSGVRPELLEFELTESILMTDSEGAVKTLKNLKASGIRLSVDDFGTGYSSLAYLKRFPLDALKIDRAFIRDVTTDADGAAIVLAIINLAHSLKLNVVAEGVETDAQLQFLRKQGCDEMQGYFFARPQSADACTRALLEGCKLPQPNSVHWLTRKA